MTSDPFADLEEGATVRRPEASDGIFGFRVRVVQGPDRGKECRIALHDPSVLVGQSPACTLQVSDPEVSRRHLEFSVDGGKLCVRDLGSTNGTFVDDVEVTEARLRGGEHVRLGATAMLVERALSGANDHGKHTSAFGSSDRFGRFLGASPEMRRLYPLIARLTGSTIPVIIEGETGTGKEVLAESIHDTSGRSAGPYVVFDCTAVPASLVEAELFGHEKGAFTGAAGIRKGVFEQAHGGTLLIDEIGDLDLSLQPKLLRALERSEVRRIGGDRWLSVDVRVLAATRRNLDREVQLGRFRDDLFHRLSVGRVELPPLRKRTGDIAFLAAHFWSALGGKGAVPSDVMARWKDDAWSGNTRELRNAVARHLVVGDLEAVETSDEPSTGPVEVEGDVIADVLAQKLPLPIARLRVVEVLERRYIESVLAEHGGSVSRAAEASGIGRRYFQMIRGRIAKR